MDEIRGLLFAKVKGKGSRSEGPEYYIKPTDKHKIRWSEVLVRKRTHLWQNDPKLNVFLGKKVIILGEIIETKDTITVDYWEIKELD